MTALTLLPGQVRDHDTRLSNLQAELRNLQARIDSRTSGTGREPATNLTLVHQKDEPPASVTVIDTTKPTIEKGVRLLAQGHYASARATFEKLRLVEPSDARVWYFGALAVGLVSGDWDDQATDLAEKGLARERAGTPSSAEIDATLARLAPITGESWLNSFRRRSLNGDRTP